MTGTFIKTLITSLILCGISSIANATFITFDDRAEWSQAVENIQTIDFNNITSDVWIENTWGLSYAPFDAGPFTISEIGSQTVNAFIDAPAYRGGYGNIDGSTYLRTDVQRGSTRIT